MNTDPIREFTLWARSLLTQEASELLRGIYGLKEDGTFFPAKDMPALQMSNAPRNEEQKTEMQFRQDTRQRLEQLIADEKDAGIEPKAAVAKLVKEVAFTHLNRMVALKMLEHPERRVVKRAALTGYPDPNGFKMYLPEHESDYKLYQQGTEPLDELTESPRDQAYRHFLLWQCGELAKEVRVLFDTDNLASRLFPRPKVLRELIERLSTEGLQEAWNPGNEETIGWVYQYFNEPDLEQFRGQTSKQVPPELVGPRTQNYTPRWVVRFLVENTLGRLWLSMHPDSKLASEMDYLVPLAEEAPRTALRPISQIKLLDPATGTMHFGLIAFDLLAAMYREEMEQAGQKGWPSVASVSDEDDIPRAILANNLHGIDIDLRAIQLACLALYVRAKQMSSRALVGDINLACSDVKLFRGKHLERIADEMDLPKTLTRDFFRQFCQSLDEAAQMGTLVRLEKHFQRLGSGELLSAINRYAQQHQTEKFFVNESIKGLRLLQLVSGRYDVVFTNPPYLDSRDYNPALKKFLSNNYKDVTRNLYGAMMQRCLELLSPDGRLGLITGQSFMFISSFEKLRQHFVSAGAVECMAHFDYGLFKARVDTTAFVFRRESFSQARQDSVGIYFRLVKEADADAKKTAFERALGRRKEREADSHVYEYRQGDFAAIPSSPWVYWITPGLRRLFVELPKLEDFAKPRVGLQTSLNSRFLRQWWEVGINRVGTRCTDSKMASASGKTWFPYMKGGGFRRWYGNQENCVNWENDGAEIKACVPDSVIRNPDCYFQRGITWTDLTGGRFSARLSPGGFIFDVAGSSVFPADVELVMGVMNSSWAQYALKLINPTVHVQVGDLSRMPLQKQSTRALQVLVDQAITLAEADSREDEFTYDFIAPPAWPDGVSSVGQRHQQLADIERQIDEEVYQLYEIADDDRKAVEFELAVPVETGETADEEGISDSERSCGEAEDTAGDFRGLAARWIHYAAGTVLGRFQPGVQGALGCGSFSSAIAARLRDFASKDGIMVLEEGNPLDLAQHILNVLSAIYGDTETERIVRAATDSTEPLRITIETYLVGQFFRDHVRRYRKRPIYWLMQSPKKSYSLCLFHEKATADTLSLLRGNRYLGGRINRLQQEQTSLRAAIARGDRGANAKAGRIAELLEELQEFDRRLEAATRASAKDKHGHDVTVRWEPELDDGVYINAAPLHELFPSWRDVNPKKAWQELAAGEYDWSRTAMRYWPQRVLAKCKDNKSYAIAHGLA